MSDPMKAAWESNERRGRTAVAATTRRETQPADVLRLALVALLADLLREAETKLEAAHVACLTSPMNEPDFPTRYNRRGELYKDTEALRRVMEIVRRETSESRSMTDEERAALDDFTWAELRRGGERGKEGDE